MTAARNCELARDRRKDDFDFIAEPNQNRDGNDGNKGQDQGVLDEGLAFPVPFSATRCSLMIYVLSDSMHGLIKGN